MHGDKETLEDAVRLVILWRLNGPRRWDGCDAVAGAGGIYMGVVGAR